MHNCFDRKNVKSRAKAGLRKCYWLSFGVAAIVSLILNELPVFDLSLNFSEFGREASSFESTTPFALQPPPSGNDGFLPLIAVFVVFVCLLIVALFVGAAFVKAYFLDGVVRVGDAKFFLGVTRGEGKFKDVLFGFGKHYNNIRKVLFARFWKLLLWELFVLIPIFGIALGITLLEIGGMFIGTVGIMLSALGLIPSMIPYLIKTFEYSMIPYLMAEFPDMSVKDAFAASRELTNGHKGELFVLDLSFIGWQLLGILSFGVGGVFLQPYIKASWAEAYAELCRLQCPPSPTPFAPVENVISVDPVAQEATTAPVTEAISACETMSPESQKADDVQDAIATPEIIAPEQSEE